MTDRWQPHPLPEFAAALLALGTNDKERARALRGAVTFRTVQEMRAGAINKSLYGLLHVPQTLYALAHDGERRLAANERGAGGGFPEFEAMIRSLGTNDKERARMLEEVSFRTVQELKAGNLNKALYGLVQQPQVLYALAHDAERLLAAREAGRVELHYPIHAMELPSDWMAPGTPEAAVAVGEETPELEAA